MGGRGGFLHGLQCVVLKWDVFGMCLGRRDGGEREKEREVCLRLG